MTLTKFRIFKIPFLSPMVPKKENEWGKKISSTDQEECRPPKQALPINLSHCPILKGLSKSQCL